MPKPLFDPNKEWEDLSNVISDKSAKQETDPIGSKTGTPIKESE